MFRTVPLSIIRSFSLYTQQWYMSYRFADSLRAGSGRNVLILLARCTTCTIAVCTVWNSWWLTEELSETCTVLFRIYIWEVSASNWPGSGQVADACECGTEPSGSVKCGNFLTSCKPVSFSRRTLHHGVSIEEVHLVGFIIRIYHNAQSQERQKSTSWAPFVLKCTLF